MTEAEYDTEIAPALAELMRKVADKGGAMLCYVRFDGEDGGDSFGLTMHAPNPSVHERIIELALKTRGNFDAIGIVLTRLHKAGTIDASQSLLLSRYIGAKADD